MKRRILVIICGALAVSACSLVAHAQARRSAGGCDTAATNAEGKFAEIGKYFWDPEYAVNPAISQSGRTSEDGVVSSPGTCQAILNAAVRSLRQHEPSWPDVESSGFHYLVFKYHGSYAILIEPTARRFAFVPVLVFNVRGLSYVTTILV